MARMVVLVPDDLLPESADGLGLPHTRRQAGRSLARWPMDDPDDPRSRDNLSWNWSRGGPTWRPFSGRRGLRLPPPPGPPPKPGKAEREQEKRADARAE